MRSGPPTDSLGDVTALSWPYVGAWQRTSAGMPPSRDEPLDVLLRRFLHEGAEDRRTHQTSTSSILEKIEDLGARVSSNHAEMQEDIRGVKARVRALEDQFDGGGHPRATHRFSTPSAKLASLMPPPPPLVIETEESTGVHKRIADAELDRIKKRFDDAETSRLAVAKYAADLETKAKASRERLIFWVTFLGGLIPVAGAVAYLLSHFTR